jgi:flagellin-like protein
MVKGELEKRALSPVVASVLLVALVMVLASIVFLWARGFIGEQIEKGDAPISDLCSEVTFNVELITSAVSGVYDVEIVNTGNVAIHKFTIVKSLDGSEERYEFALGVNPQENARQEADLRINNKKPDKVIIYPALLGTEVGTSTNRPYTCIENGYTQVL